MDTRATNREIVKEVSAATQNCVPPTATFVLRLFSMRSEAATC